MRHLLLRHDALDAEGFAAQLAGTPGEVAQAILGAAREGLTGTYHNLLRRWSEL